MKHMVLTGIIVFALALPTAGWSGKGDDSAQNGNKSRAMNIQLGPRPFFLVQDMDQSPLKDKLESCERGPFKRTDFSIGHRGAPLQFPEHTLESYQAAARMGAGIVECDVTFTQDKELWQWRKTTIDGVTERRSGSIVLLDEARNEVLRWNFREGWIIKWEGPALKATANETAIEALEIVHEGLELV